ncbi:MAG: mercury methylation corrinoid protein HgcA, partial [Pseudomonadota bacterium]
AYRVKKACGFEVVWGPIRAEDIRSFLEAGLKVDRSMRVVRFGLWDRLVLTPIELTQVIKPALLALVAIFIFSGVGPEIFSFGQAWSRGLVAALSLVAAVLTGALLAPVLLPWIPGRAFSIKGALTGLIGAALVLSALWGRYEWMQGLALVLMGVALSSYLTMNFTGSTPFTSPSGVEKEMRRALPLQALALLAAAVLWIAAPFVG